MTIRAEKIAPDTASKAVPDEHQIVDKIFTAVMEQQLPPNTKLSESQLCKSFGVGRMRVRRALLLLANQGIVELYSNRGAFIACPDQKSAHEVFEVRRVLETAVVRQIAGGAEPHNLKDLEYQIEIEEQAVKSRDRRQIIRLSGKFHVGLAVATGNSVYKNMMRELVTRTSLIIGLFGTSGVSSCPVHEHSDILSAIRSRDKDLAEELVCAHLLHIEADLDLSGKHSEQPDLVSILGNP